jgi:ketopantoate reductase
MLQDLMNGRPTEIAYLNGAIAERAAKHGIDARRTRSSPG